jgi:hypothetical protein
MVILLLLILVLIRRLIRIRRRIITAYSFIQIIGPQKTLPRGIITRLKSNAPIKTNKAETPLDDNGAKPACLDRESNISLNTCTAPQGTPLDTRSPDFGTQARFRHRCIA